MKKVYLAAGSDKSIEALSSVLGGIGLTETEVFHDAAGMLSALNAEALPDLVVINTPLSDGMGLDAAADIADKWLLPVMVVTSADAAEKAGPILEKHGAAVLTRPIEKKSLTAAAEVLLSLSIMTKKLREERNALAADLQEIKLVNRAKAMLIKNLGMTEAQAHRYIEKQAMDLRCSRSKIAGNILKTYYNK